MFHIKLNISFIIRNIIVFIFVYLFLIIKQSIFDDTIEWSSNIVFSIFMTFLNIYINRLIEKDRANKNA